MEYKDFDEFKSKIIIRGTLVTKSTLHIGGMETGGNENSIIKIKRGRYDIPFIPGSSIKGKLRSESERWLRGIQTICTPNKLCNSDDKEEGEYCLICGIFGGFSLASHIRIIDSFPVQETIPVEIKPGVAINRILGTAQSKALYQMEIVGPEQSFNFEMIIENIDFITVDGTINKNNNDLRLTVIYNILRKLLNKEFQIGGKSSSGMGVVQLIDVTANVSHRDMKDSFLLVDKKYKLSIDDNLRLNLEVKK